MRVEVPTEEISQIYKWLEENIGLQGHGWILKTEPIIGSRYGLVLAYIEIDNAEEALVYKLKFGL